MARNRLQLDAAIEAAAWLLRTDLAQLGLRSVAVSACGRGEGATTIALALASAAARIDAVRVLLIDADPAGGLSKYTGVGGPGLRDLSAAPAELPAGLKEILPRLDLMPNGSAATALVDLQASGALVALNRLALEKYDLVVWDTAPVGECMDTRILLGTVKDVVLVTETDHTRISAVATAVREIESLNARVVSAVRNRTERLVTARLFGRD